MTIVVGGAAGSRPPDWLVRQLPAGLLGDDFFVRFVSLFQAEADTLVAHAENLPHLADMRMAPPELVRWMAGWIGAPGIDPSFPEPDQRDMLAASAEVLRTRGTLAALRRQLEVVSGGTVEIDEGGGVFEPDEAPADTAWTVVSVSGSALVTDDALVRLILEEIPAHVRAEIWVDDTLRWPLPGENNGSAPRSTDRPSEGARE